MSAVVQAQHHNSSSSASSGGKYHCGAAKSKAKHDLDLDLGLKMTSEDALRKKQLASSEDSEKAVPDKLTGTEENISETSEDRTVNMTVEIEMKKPPTSDSNEDSNGETQVRQKFSFFSVLPENYFYVLIVLAFRLPIRHTLRAKKGWLGQGIDTRGRENNAQ